MLVINHLARPCHLPCSVQYSDPNGWRSYVEQCDRLHTKLFSTVASLQQVLYHKKHRNGAVVFFSSRYIFLFQINGFSLFHWWSNWVILILYPLQTFSLHQKPNPNYLPHTFRQAADKPPKSFLLQPPLLLKATQL